MLLNNFKLNLGKDFANLCVPASDLVIIKEICTLGVILTGLWVLGRRF